MSNTIAPCVTIYRCATVMQRHCVWPNYSAECLSPCFLLAWWVPEQTKTATSMTYLMSCQKSLSLQQRTGNIIKVIINTPAKHWTLEQANTATGMASWIAKRRSYSKSALGIIQRCLINTPVKLQASAPILASRLTRCTPDRKTSICIRLLFIWQQKPKHTNKMVSLNKKSR